MTSTFKMIQWMRIAKMLGQMRESDEMVQFLTEKFGAFFLGDNPRFNYKWFQSRVTREREGTYIKVEEDRKP